AVRGWMSSRSRYVHVRVRKPCLMMNASLRPNCAADTSRMSLSVSTLLPFSSAHERAQRLSGAFPVRRVVREQDGLHVKVREPGDRFAGLGHVVGEEIVRERDLSLHPLQQ